MTRKGPSFGQLIDYLDQGAAPDDPAFLHNLYPEQSAAQIARAFLINHQHLPRRKRGNSLYHEIISLEGQAELRPDQWRVILFNLASLYVERRAPRQLVYGRVHLDTEHPHIHLLISANGLRSAKRKRLSRRHFRQVQIEMERLARELYPELEHRSLYDRPDRQRPKISRQEGERTRRTNQLSRKQALAQNLREQFGSKMDFSALQVWATAQGHQLYQRGQQWGLIVEGRKYRLKTLGLELDPRAAKLKWISDSHLHQREKPERAL